MLRATPRLLRAIRRAAPGIALGMLRAAPGRVLASPLTLTFIAMNVAIHAVATGGIGFDLTSLADISGGSIADEVRGEWWRLVTSGWVHRDTNHLIGNMTFLGLYGLALEPIVGSRWFAFVFGASLLGSSVAELGFGGGGTSIGASGAVFGLNGAVLVVAMSYGGWWSRLLRLGAWCMVGGDIVDGFESLGVAHAAHLGGFLAGMTVAAGIESSRAGAPLIRSRRKTLAVATMTLGLIAITAADSRWMPSWFASQARMQEALDNRAAAAKQWALVVETADASRPLEARLIADAAYSLYFEDDTLVARRLFAEVSPALRNANTYATLGWMQMRYEPRDRRAAEISYLIALELEPESPVALNSLALLYLSDSDSALYRPEVALSLSRRAMLADGMADPFYVRTCAYAHFHCDEDAAAVELMRLAIRLESEYSETYEKDLTRMLKWIEENGAKGTALTPVGGSEIRP